MAPLRIEVTGQSIIHVPAELAIISLDAKHESTDPQVARQRVMDASLQLRDNLVKLSNQNGQREDVIPPVIEWSNSTLSTGSYLRFGGSITNSKGENIFNASMGFQATFQDFSRLGIFAAFVMSLDDINIYNITWELTAATRESLGTQSRTDAVRNALKKGCDFASAVDVTGLQVVEIKDDPEPPPMARSFGFRAAPGGGEQVLSFEPQKVTLECKVLVTLEKS